MPCWRFQALYKIREPFTIYHLCVRRDLSLEWKVEGVIDGESAGGDCDEVICAGWGHKEDSEQNEVDGMKKGADSTGKVMHVWKSGW